MPINRTVAIVLNAGDKTIRPSDIAEASGITTGQASTELLRLVRMGIARRIGRGEYQLFDNQKAVDFLNKDKHNNTTKHNIRDNTAPPDVLVRPHRIWFRAKVQNMPIIKGAIKCGVSRVGAWRMWETNQNLTFYEKLMGMPNGTYATVRYAQGNRKRTVTVKCEDVMVNGLTLQDHMRDINEAVEQGLRALCREDGIQVGLIQLTCDHHYGIALNVEGGWRLPPPGIVRINEFWWMDRSTGWPEIETHLQAQAKRLVELPDRVDKLPSEMEAAISNALRKYFGKPEAMEAGKPGTGAEA